MDKIRLSSEDIEFILKWRDEHADLVRTCANPLRIVKIICFESDYTITAVRNGSSLSFGITHRGKSLGKLCFTVLETGMCLLAKNTTRLNKDDRCSVLTVYMSVMALLVFGRSTVYPDAEPVRKITPGERKKTKHPVEHGGITYILSRSGKEPYLTAHGHHRSPEGSFSVRGHFRHYKDGKVIWISEYTKGHGTRKDKTYKIGQTDMTSQKKQ